jgi:hypothetical protein
VRSSNRWGHMTVATLTTAMSAENRKAVIAGTIGNVLFGVYGYFATTISQLFFPGDDKTISLLKAFAVFGVGESASNAMTTSGTTETHTSGRVEGQLSAAVGGYNLAALGGL